MKFEEILKEYNVPYKTIGRYTRAGWIQFRCPFCLGGRDPNKLYAGYSLERGVVNCWRCGVHWVGNVLAALTGAPTREVMGLLDAHTNRPHQQTERRGRYNEPTTVGPLSKAHRNYLRGRGFNPKKLQDLWDLKGIGLASRLSWRVFIPIYLDGRKVSWTTRSIGNAEPRYISAAPKDEAYPHKELLYGADYVRGRAVVVEGPTGVWRLGPGTVATLGTQYTPGQLLALTQYAAVAVCLDPEPAAQARARAMADDIAALGGNVCNIVLDGVDPGELDNREVRYIRKHFLDD